MSMCDYPQARPKENATSLGNSLRRHRAGMFSELCGAGPVSADTRVGKLQAYVGALRATGLQSLERGRENKQRFIKLP